MHTSIIWISKVYFQVLTGTDGSLIKLAKVVLKHHSWKPSEFYFFKNHQKSCIKWQCYLWVHAMFASNSSESLMCQYFCCLFIQCKDMLNLTLFPIGFLESSFLPVLYVNIKLLKTLREKKSEEKGKKWI